MVILHWTLTPLAAAANGAGDPLPPTTRAAVLMALLGIALVGLLLVAVILLGGRWVRRQGSYRRASAVPPDRAPIVRSDGRGGPAGPEVAADDAEQLSSNPPRHDKTAGP